MAKTKKNDRDLIDTLRASGLRKKVAQTLASSSRSKPKGKAAKAVDESLQKLRGVTTIIERRAQEARRSEAGKKAARTRKRNQAKRSTAAKKGAKTRAKSR
jgi:hypothetical protein